MSRVFYISVISGLACLILGLLLRPSIINPGLLFGGTLSIATSFRMRSLLVSDLTHFTLLVIALIIVIAASYFKTIRKKEH